MDLWHATVVYNGNEYHEDRVGQQAAIEWAEAELRALGHKGGIQWQRGESVCTVRLGPDKGATVARRIAEPPSA